MQACMSNIEANELVKRYADFTAVKGISFNVRQGEIFGLLGPNGAGKTSIINMLIGLARIDGGEVHCGGLTYTQQVDGRVQTLMGVVPDESNLYDEMTGLDNLVFCGALYSMAKPARIQRAQELIRLVGLTDHEDRLFRSYSRGMKRKLTIAAALMHRPNILFLDETTTGLDVASAREIRSLIQDLNAAGTTVFLTTHYIEEAEQLCHRVAFLVGGRIVRTGTVTDLLRFDGGRTVVQLALNQNAAQAARALTAAIPDTEVEVLDETTVRVYGGERMNLIPYLTVLERFDQQVFEAKVLKPSLEDVFLQETGLTTAAMRSTNGGGRRST